MWSLAVALVLLALVIAAVAVMVRNFKSGKNSCGMNCSSCMHHEAGKTCGLEENMSRDE